LKALNQILHFKVRALLVLPEIYKLLHENSFIPLKGFNLLYKATVFSDFNILSTRWSFGRCLLNLTTTFVSPPLSLDGFQKMLLALKKAFIGPLPSIRVNFMKSLEYHVNNIKLASSDLHKNS
jgi:hypothetical protein